MLAECQSAEEVRANYKAVRARTRQWKAPPRRIEIKQPEPVAEPVPVVVVAPPPVEEIPVDNVVVASEDQPLRIPTIAEIIAAVSRRYGVPRLDVVSDRRTVDVVLPRQIVMYLARTYTLQSLPAIGRHLGGRDHTTILFGVRKITRLRKTDPALDATLNELAEQLGAA